MPETILAPRFLIAGCFENFQITGNMKAGHRIGRLAKGQRPSSIRPEPHGIMN